MESVGIIGTGLVGRALARALKNSGIEVMVYNRTFGKAELLAESIRVHATSSLKELATQPMIILAVSDLAIPEVFQKVKPYISDQTVVHTSGTLSIDLLQGIKNHGLLYPLDSFGHDTDWDMSSTPIFVDANNSKTLADIKAVGYELSREVYQLEEDKRPWLHLAAVITNNFTMALIGEAQSILADHNIPKNALDKLLSTTVLKALKSSTDSSMTGPAKRGDINTIKRHLELINDEELAELYKLLSNRINARLKL